MAAVLVTDDTMLDAPAWNDADIWFFNHEISIQMPTKAPTIIIKGMPIPKKTDLFIAEQINMYTNQVFFSPPITFLIDIS